MERENVKYGGYMSVRAKGERPLFCFGQDECIFKQYLFTNKAWVTPEGIRPLVQKDEGMGVMVSAFVSREFGFGFHDRNKTYRDKEAAVLVHGKDGHKKQDLKESPFVHFFDYGKNLQGYWTYERMVIQLEDCIDVLQALHGKDCDYLFMFDHSNGHDKQKPNGLNANAMNKKYGGSQPAMRNSEIKDQDHLGPFNHPGRLKINEEQHFTFDQPTDLGPCWMTREEQLANEFDVELQDEPMIEHVFVKAHLATKLQEKGLPFNGNKKQLQKRCQDHGIPIAEKRWKVKTGWRNQPKGMLQILWERGFIDPSIPISELESRYPVGGQKDNLGQAIAGTAMKDILANLPDFANEKTLLEWHATERSTDDCKIFFMRSPKCHPEIAGEGIEYDWAGAKTAYRHAKPSEKKSAAGFKKLVEKCLGGLGFHQRISFSAKAQQYMLAYEVMAAWEDNELPEELKDGEGKLPESSAQLLDKIVKCKKKCHRCIDSKDGAWVNRIMNAMKDRDHVIVIDD